MHIRGLDKGGAGFSWRSQRNNRGIQIVSAEWIKQMITPYLKLVERSGLMEYGYLWYKPCEDKEFYAAIGDSGNIIYVNKEVSISVGITGTFKPRIFDGVEFIEENVLPLIM